MIKSELETSVFDRFAQEYDEWFDIHVPAYLSELEAIRRFIPGGRIGVEVGVGTGRFASPLGIPAGVEPSRPMGVLALSRGIEVIQAKAEALPFVEGAFDFVLFVNVICFLDAPVRSLKETYRILKPKGRIILALIDKSAMLGRAYEYRKASNKFYENARFFSARQVIGFLLKAGFVDIQSCQTIFTSPTEMTAPDPVLNGHGKGGFVVLKGLKGNSEEPAVSDD